MRIDILALCGLLLTAPLWAASDPLPAIIPAPQKMELAQGSFTLASGTPIITDPASAQTGDYLRERLSRATGYAIKLEQSSPGAKTVKGAILLTTRDAKAALGAEGYELAVTPDAVVIRAPQQAGLFYGVQTLLQLLPLEVFSTNAAANTQWQAPCVRIEDQPRFAWRGMMLDVSRHFQGREFVLRYLDQMAMHKMNVFHWHLTDDQGWRIEIKKYPKLTSVGAWRKQPGYPDNNGIYGGFYTQEDIREIVAYAAVRHIAIVPEIDLPGHSQAAIAAYPEFGCTGEPGFVGYFFDYPSPPAAKFPPNSCDVYCAGNPKSIGFIKDVLTETMALFPGQYIHVGGDEVVTNFWSKCDKCQGRMRAEGLKNYHELQGALTREVGDFLGAHQRRLIGWDEILQGGLGANDTVMSWRGPSGGTAGGIEAVTSGHSAVMAPHRYLYFNRAQSTAPGQPPSPVRALISLETVYKFDPIPERLPPEQAALILGAQGCLWTERLHRSDWLETMTYPRLCALAEVTWSPKQARDWNGFTKRMESHRRRLELLGVAYSHASFALAKSE